MRNNPQCQTCVFNRADFVEFCKASGADSNCAGYAYKIAEKCAVCGDSLDVVEWFTFGNKCALHGVED
jgi:hypothetical protein